MDYLLSLEPTENIEEYLENWNKQLKEDPEAIKATFQGICNPDGMTTLVGTEQKNLLKNRYNGIFAYDYNRVQLSAANDDCDSDYINASYIRDYNGIIKYIATQAPIKATVEDFWSMIVEQNVKNIVALTNIEKQEIFTIFQCFPYWDDDQEEVFGKYSVRCISREKFDDWIERRLAVTDTSDADNTPIYVNHFHYVSWPDKSVPNNKKSLVSLMKRVNEQCSKADWPIVLHCLAGVGRTGTYICIEQLIDMIDHHGSIVDVKSFISHLRSQRVDMVETLDQYKYIHEVLMQHCSGKN